MVEKACREPQRPPFPEKIRVRNKRVKGLQVCHLDPELPGNLAQCIAVFNDVRRAHLSLSL